MRHQLLTVSLRGSLLEVVAHPTSPHVAVAVRLESTTSWFCVDVTDGTSRPLELDTAGVVIFESGASHYVLTSSGALYSWPTGTFVAASNDWSFPMSICDSRRPVCTPTADGFVGVHERSMSKVTEWTGHFDVRGRRANARVVVDTASCEFVPCSLAGNAVDGLVAFSGADRVAHVSPSGDVRRIDHFPRGHTVGGVLARDRPYALVLSGRAELLDLSTGLLVDTIDLPTSDKLAAVWHEGAFVIASHDFLWRYEPTSGECIELGVLPGSSINALSPTITISAGGLLLVLRAEGLLAITNTHDIGDEPRHAGRLSAYLPESRRGMPWVHAAYGSSSIVVEAASGHRVLRATGSRCPACGKLDCWTPLSPMGFESAGDPGDAAGRIRPHGYLGRSAAEYDESTFLTFHLCELFRGSSGAAHLGRWLASLATEFRGLRPREVLSWASVVAGESESAEVSRPCLLIDTFDNRLVGLIALPLRSHAEATTPSPRIDSCREAIAGLAQAFGKFGSVVVIAPDGHPGLEDSVDLVVPWPTALQRLADTAGADTRASRSVARWMAGIMGAPFPPNDHAWDDAIEPRSRRFDFETPAFGYRNQWTLGAPVEVCSGCGWTRCGPKARASRETENPAVLDLLGELASDHRVATKWLNGLELGFGGEISRVLCWPRLAQHGSSPDAVFVSPRSIVVLEAKHPGVLTVANVQLAREVLVRIANGIFLSMMSSDSVDLRVLVLGQVRKPFAFSKALSALVWGEFVGAGRSVPKWSTRKANSTAHIALAGDPVAMRIEAMGLAGIESILAVRTFAQAATELANVAEELAASSRSSSPESWAAYRGLRLRAEGFTAIRTLAR